MLNSVGFRTLEISPQFVRHESISLFWTLEIPMFVVDETEKDRVTFYLNSKSMLMLTVDGGSKAHKSNALFVYLHKIVK